MVRTQHISRTDAVVSQSVETTNPQNNPTASPFSEQMFPLNIESLNNDQSAQIKWSETGKPFIQGLEAKNIDVSLSHDERFCLCVSGYGNQGCDIAPITERSFDDWLALLSFKRESLLRQLIDQGQDSVNEAGTRIWSTIEALRKASQAKTIDLVLEKIEGKNVLLRGIIDHQSIYVLTFPMTLTRHPQRMVAVVVTKSAAAMSSTPNLVQAEDNKIALSSEKSEKVLTWRWPVCYKETSNISQSVYFSHFFRWMGQVRDWAIYPIRHQLGQYLETGRWGMVTNSSQLDVIGELGLNDEVEVHFWVSHVVDSTIHFDYDWFKVNSEDKLEKIAHSQLIMTWVEIDGGKGTKIHPLPNFLADFVNSLHETSSFSQEHQQSSKVTPSLNPHQWLKQESFLTSLEETDAIGNINFATYSSWQGRLRDRFCYDLIPEFYRRSCQLGEFRCVRSRIEYLREALPFEDIQVSMGIKSTSETSMTLEFVYFRRNKGGNLQKIAIGEQEAVWLLANELGQFQPSPLPEAIKQALLIKD